MFISAESKSNIKMGIYKTTHFSFSPKKKRSDLCIYIYNFQSTSLARESTLEGQNWISLKGDEANPYLHLTSKCLYPRDLQSLHSRQEHSAQTKQETH